MRRSRSILFTAADLIFQQTWWTSYQYKLDEVGPVDHKQQQIQLCIHICTSQRCCYRYNWLHKHLETGIHQNLKRVKRVRGKVFINRQNLFRLSTLSRAKWTETTALTGHVLILPADLRYWQIIILITEKVNYDIINLKQLKNKTDHLKLDTT